MRAFSPFLIASIVFLSLGASTSQADIACALRDVFYSILPKKQSPQKQSAEDASLAAFRVSGITARGFENLSEHNGVFRVRLKNGESYIIRLPTTTADTRFEKFATSFMLSAPNVRTPKVRSLAGAEASALLDKIETIIPDFFEDGEVSHNWITAVKNGTPISITLNQPNTKTGSDYLQTIGARADLEELLVAIAENYHYKSSRGQAKAAVEIPKAWRLMPKTDQLAFLEKLKEISPVAHDVSLSELPDFLIKNITTLNGLNVAALFDAKLKKVPPAIKTQLADHWAVFVTLGITDFHWKNWLVQDGKVIAIDMAFKTLFFSDGTYLNPMTTQHPFGSSATGRQTWDMLKKNMSGAMRRHLKSLDKEKIRVLAAQSDFEINENQANAILVRRNMILGLR